MPEMHSEGNELESLHRALERSRRDYRLLFDSVPCYITVQDRDFHIFQSNALFRADFGSCFGERCFEAYKGADAVCTDCPVEKTFADGQVHTSEEHVLTLAGEHANMMVTSMPVTEEDGEVTAVMEVSTNVTEVKRLQSLATVGLAVTGMAHRIKNILMGLEGGVYVVNAGFETDDRESVDHGWSMVQRNVQKISRVTTDLLFCSKDREPILEDGVCPVEIVGEIHDLFHDRAAADGVDVLLEVGPSHTGTFDPEALRNLVTNLVANAVDACRFDLDAEDKQHRIHLRCHLDATDSTVIEVSDNGAGIPEAVRPKVFEGFFSTKGTEGTGLGLLVVQKVVEEHGGEVSFASEEGNGTTFTVVLPRHETTRRTSR
jgi:signal transduction histidine kinase